MSEGNMEHTSTTNIYASELFVLFAGYEKAFGRYTVKRANNKGKMEGRATTVPRSITVEDWRTHVKGTGPGVGIIPLRADNTVLWGAIDIDVIGIDHKALEAKCKSLNLPLVICSSKSGGAHLYLFLAEAVDAKRVVSVLQQWSAVLGHGGCEVFPKQTSRYDEKDVGNWLNLPYFDADNTVRHCIRDGKPITLPDFIEFAKSMRVSDERLIESRAGTSDDGGMFSDGPPCLQFLAANGGFPDGARNEGLYDVAVYLKKKDGIDGVKGRLNDYNSSLCHPTLPASDVQATEKSVSKNDYEYKCRHAPIAAHCNRALCVRREFGVFDTTPILSLQKYVGDPVLWFFEVDGKRFAFTTKELMTQKLFQQRLGEAINRYPRTLSQNVFEQKIDAAMKAADIIYAPEDETPYGLFKEAVRGYLLGQARTLIVDELLNPRPSPYFAKEQSEYWFTLSGVRHYLDTHRVQYASAQGIGQWLRAMGATNNEGKTTWIRKRDGTRGQAYLWKMKSEMITPLVDAPDNLNFGEDGDPERNIEF
jgi:hypothetical protein